MAEDKGKLVIKLESSRSSCAGAAAAYLLRRLAARAGSYAPGIQEHIFYEIGQQSHGSTLEQVERWIRAQSTTFAALGYYVLAHRLAATTADIRAWVEEGEGFRAAILMTDGTRLHRDIDMPSSYAVGLTFNDATGGISDETDANGLLMVDAWPGKARFTSPPATLDPAHRAHKYSSLLLFWAGHG